MMKKPRKDKGKLRSRPYQRHKPWQPYTCECGAVIQTTYTGKVHKAHIASVRHRYGKRLQALLATNCLTYEEIGKRLGITRERVRQLGKAMGLLPDGHERRKVCTLRRREQRFEEYQTEFIGSLGNTRLGRFLSACVEHGHTNNQLVLHDDGKSYYLDRATVSGKSVKVKAAWLWAPYGTREFVRITNSSAPVDLIAYEMHDGRWMFLKPWMCGGGARSTCFSLNTTFKGMKGYTLNKAHHYRDAIDNWAILNGG